jgi:hypothetical protein
LFENCFSLLNILSLEQKCIFSKKYFPLSANALGPKYFFGKKFFSFKYFAPRTKIRVFRKYFPLKANALGRKYLGENIYREKLKKKLGQNKK